MISRDEQLNVCAKPKTINNKLSFSESLILAQNERWQRGLGMQVERDPRGRNIPW